MRLQGPTESAGMRTVTVRQRPRWPPFSTPFLLLLLLLVHASAVRGHLGAHDPAVPLTSPDHIWRVGAHQLDPVPPPPPAFAVHPASHGRTVLIIPINATSTPHSHLAEFLACTLSAHVPSVAGVEFDVGVAVYGEDEGSSLVEKRDALHGMVARAVAATDMTKHSRGRHQPNLMVLRGYRGYRLSLGDILMAAFTHGRTAGGTASFERFASEPHAPPQSSSSHHYTYAVVLEPDVCALRVGWLDIALAPLLRDPTLQAVRFGGGRVQCVRDPAHQFRACVEGKDADSAAALVSTSQQGGPACISGAYRLSDTVGSMLASGEAGPAAALHRPWHSSAPNPDDMGRLAGGAGPPLLHNHNHANLIRVEAPVDEDLFADASYYGTARRAALVHAPRHLRVPGPRAVAARLGRPATLILLPSLPTPGLHDLVRVLWRSLHEAGAHRTGIAFVAQSRQGFDAASAVASQAVLLVKPARPDGGDGDDGGSAPFSFTGNCVEADSASMPLPRTTQGTLESARAAARTAMVAVSDLVRAGASSMLILGLDTAVTGSFLPELRSLERFQAGGAPVIFAGCGQRGGDTSFFTAAAHSTHNDQPWRPTEAGMVDYGAVFITTAGSPPMLADAFSYWFNATSHRHAQDVEKLHQTKEEDGGGDRDSASLGLNGSVQGFGLPTNLCASPSPGFVMPFQRSGAHHQAPPRSPPPPPPPIIIPSLGFACVHAIPGTSTCPGNHQNPPTWATATSSRLRRVSPRTMTTIVHPDACFKHTQLHRRPLRLRSHDDGVSVWRAMRVVAVFLAFLRESRMDCAVLPGFVLDGSSGGGPPRHLVTVPFDTVFNATTLQALSGGRTVFYDRRADMGTPPLQDFTSFSARKAAGHRREVQGRSVRSTELPPDLMTPWFVEWATPNTAVARGEG